VLGDILKEWPTECLELMLSLLSGLSYFAHVCYNPRGIPVTTGEMESIIMFELRLRDKFGAQPEQSNPRAASDRDSGTSREVPDQGRGRDDGANSGYSLLLHDSLGILTGTQDLDSSIISPVEFQRLGRVVIKELIDAIDLPVQGEDIPDRGGPRVNFADFRKAVMSVLIQRGLRLLGEEVVCTPEGHDEMGIFKGSECILPLKSFSRFSDCYMRAPQLLPDDS
jgi:hypothetical protein